MAQRLGQCLALAAVVAVPLNGCGVEALIVDSVNDENIPPRSKLIGTLPVANATLQVIAPDGATVTPEETATDGTTFQLNLLSTDYQNLRLVAGAGNLVWQTIVPNLPAESSVDGVEISTQTTFATMLLDASLLANERGLQSYDPQPVELTLRTTLERLSDGAETQTLWEMFERVVEAGDPSVGPPLVTNDFFDVEKDMDGNFVVVESYLNQGWLTITSVDYTGDGSRDATPDAFDAALEAAAQLNELVECFDPDNIRVVYEVDFNPGRVDDNCNELNRFNWVQDRAGKSMFFVGGIHPESDIQDSVIDSSLGNQGAWVPNQIPMFDDGTNGDEVAGDNIWTITFVLPRGMRMGYKYTWGFQGDLWTGTEEWPGNQHILQIEDINGDGFVRRRDEFGDETTNKDLANANGRGSTVTWDTDFDDNGIPDARERPIDFDNDCSLDDWLTPTGVGAAVVDCSTLE